MLQTLTLTGVACKQDVNISKVQKINLLLSHGKQSVRFDYPSYQSRCHFMVCSDMVSFVALDVWLLFTGGLASRSTEIAEKLIVFDFCDNTLFNSL